MTLDPSLSTEASGPQEVKIKISLTDHPLIPEVSQSFMVSLIDLCKDETAVIFESPLEPLSTQTYVIGTELKEF